ncbi:MULTISPECIES: hypothetical protein [Bacillus cereus group]|uniref:hypothetical protein n=1 Tax=Bacillus cereus group TaxID=86661 RepID=UPI00027A04E7|nr:MULTISPECIES: hypothetical protein [Bacillus cereus group]ARX70150.1 hypothetical protein BVH75_29825 [Bacillus thuringiensis]EJR24935.1 hypothetical protein IIE_06402 [Bacillus cereus VD045]
MRSLGKSIGEPLITKYLKATAKEKHDFQEFNDIQNLNRKSNYQKQELNDFIGNEEMKTKIKRELQKAK